MPGHVRTPASLNDIVGKDEYKLPVVHVLIRVKAEKIEHKYEDKVEKTTEKGKMTVCYWTMKRPPKQTLWLGTVRGIEGNKIMFTNGINVIGEGKIIEVKPTTNLRSGEIVFTPLKRVSYLQPKKAPTRGFTYVGT